MVGVEKLTPREEIPHAVTKNFDRKLPKKPPAKLARHGVMATLTFGDLRGSELGKKVGEGALEKAHLFWLCQQSSRSQKRSIKADVI
jgi:hypothetical protein